MGAADGRRPDERGAATLETVGVTIIAALVILGVLMAALPQGKRISETYAYWMCLVVTAGQGSCAPPSAAESREPTDPCVLTQDGVERNQKISVVVVTAEDGRRIEIQKLSNGEYRVSVTDREAAGAEVGVGGGLTVTVNDRTAGGSATAQAGASVGIRNGDVYYADEDDIDDVLDALTQDQVKDTVAGDGGPIRWLADRATDVIGISNDLPEPDEVYAEGGVSLNASAEATGLLDRASAGVSAAQMLGTRTNRDGSVTIYLKSTVSGKAGLQSLGVDTEGNPQFQGADLSGSAEVVTAVTFDSEGNMVRVSTTATAAGSSSGVASALFGGDADADLGNQEGRLRIYQATLDTDNAINRSAAQQFLLAQGVGTLGPWVNPALSSVGALAVPGFIQAALDNGTVTQQDYDTESNTVFGLDAAGKLGIQLGVSASVSTDSMSTTGAQYWDGTQWVNWEACGL
ncbi:hypothetical protein [Nocardioides sp. SYSU DS0663]|uniref:hypothetical protein n=1 Tax=Nocardioides sp. SYSU DS0663 TaxID=3416445 RepID=UPI003F4B8F2C